MSGNDPGDARALPVLDLADLDDAPCAPVDWNEVARQLKALHRREARWYLQIMGAYYKREPNVGLALYAHQMARHHGLRCPRWASDHINIVLGEAWLGLGEAARANKETSQAEVVGHALVRVGRGAPNLYSQAQSIFLCRSIYNDVMARVTAGEKQHVAFGDVARDRDISYGTVKTAFYRHRAVIRTQPSTRRRSPK